MYDFSRKDSPWGYVGACVVCGFVPSEVHHCIPGTANRQKSDKYGLTINLCRKHHREMHNKPNQGLDLFWKQEAQRLGLDLEDRSTALLRSTHRNKRRFYKRLWKVLVIRGE